MKITFKYIFAILAASAMMAACTEDPVQPEEQPGGNTENTPGGDNTGDNGNEGENQPTTVTLSAVIGVDDNIALLAGSDIFNWPENAAVGVLTSAGNFVKFTIAEGAGTQTAKFSAALAEGVTLSNVAVYPYDERLAVNNNKMTFSLPAEYEADATPAILPLFAKIAENQTEPISFNLLNGYVSINVKNVPLGAASVQFTATGQSLTGDFELDLAAETLAVNSVAGDAGNTVAFTVNTPSAANTEATYIVPVPVGTYPEYTVRYYDRYGYEMHGQTLTLPVNATVAAGTYTAAPAWECKTSVPMTNNLNLTRLEHNIVVINWDRPQAAVEGAVIPDVDFAGWADNRFDFDFYKKNSDGSLELVKHYYRQYGSAYHDGKVNGIGFGNLKPNTDYVFRIRTCPKSGKETDDSAASVNRSAFTQIEFTTPAKKEEAANVIYAQRFDTFVFGTDIKNFACGFSPNATEYLAASKVDDFDTKVTYRYPDKTDENLADKNKINQETVTKVLLPGMTSMKALYPHLGYLKFSTANTPGVIATPALTALTAPATVKVSFDATRYVTWANGAVTGTDAAVLKVTAGEISRTFELTDDWKNYEMTIEGATAETSIRFEATGKNMRLFLDNIVVTK